jgi:hypothetical protein
MIRPLVTGVCLAPGSVAVYQALLDCLCVECGATPNDACHATCTTDADPENPCQACFGEAAQGDCASQFMACLDDVGE